MMNEIIKIKQISFCVTRNSCDWREEASFASRKCPLPYPF